MYRNLDYDVILTGYFILKGDIEDYIFISFSHDDGNPYGHPDEQVIDMNYYKKVELIVRKNKINKIICQYGK